MKKSEFKQIIREILEENNGTSALDIMGELQTWLTFDSEDEELITKSNVSTSTNKQFKKFVKDWSNGMYDEDPEYAKQELMYIVSKSPIKEEFNKLLKEQDEISISPKELKTFEKRYLKFYNEYYKAYENSPEDLDSLLDSAPNILTSVLTRGKVDYFGDIDNYFMNVDIDKFEEQAINLAISIISKNHNIKEEVEDEPFEGDIEEGYFTDDDGWDEEALDEVGLMDCIRDIERMAYELRNGRRGSYGIDGTTDQDLLQALKEHYTSLGNVIEHISNKIDE